MAITIEQSRVADTLTHDLLALYLRELVDSMKQREIKHTVRCNVDGKDVQITIEEPTEQ